MLLIIETKKEIAVTQIICNHKEKTRLNEVMKKDMSHLIFYLSRQEL